MGFDVHLSGIKGVEAELLAPPVQGIFSTTARALLLSLQRHLYHFGLPTVFTEWEHLAGPRRVAQARNHASLRHWQTPRAATTGRHQGDSGGQASGGGAARSRDRRTAGGLRRQQQQLRKQGSTLAPLHTQTRAGRWTSFKRLAHPCSPIPPLSTLTSRATHAHPTSPRSTGFWAIWNCISSSSNRVARLAQSNPLLCRLGPWRLLRGAVCWIR